jgi:hypothetical protein
VGQFPRLVLGQVDVVVRTFAVAGDEEGRHVTCS